MNSDLDKKLCEKYPKIFVNRNSSINASCMAFGFECDNGWYTLIDVLCYTIQYHIDHKIMNNKPITQVVADQVKEKFGELRFYTSGGDEFTDGVLDLACKLSTKICEICGNIGYLKCEKGWYKTKCDNCV